MSLAGHCLCGAVRFRAEGAARRGVGLCHCGQCRRWSAGPFMVAWFEGGIRLEEAAALRWYASSDRGERGFCGRCGSTLFWRRPGAARDWGASVNAFGDAHGLEIGEHVWVEDAPGWYAFADAAPRRTAAQCLGEDRS